MSELKQEQIQALGRLGWSLRRIERELGVRRETASRYMHAAGIPVREPGSWGHRPPDAATEPISDAATEPISKPAIETISEPRPRNRRQQSTCEEHREFIQAQLKLGRTARSIWQELVEERGYPAQYATVSRFVRRLRTVAAPAHEVIHTPPGEESQVDYGTGPLVRDPETGRYRRTRLFVMTLGYSRMCVRLLTWRSSVETWARLHERAFRRLGGATQLVVLDNLREGVKRPDIYDPEANQVYRALLAHYGVTTLPCRVRDPNRKGKVESGIGHTQSALRGKRFESLEEAHDRILHHAHVLKCGPKSYRTQAGLRTADEEK